MFYYKNIISGIQLDHKQNNQKLSKYLEIETKKCGITISVTIKPIYSASHARNHYQCVLIKASTSMITHKIFETNSSFHVK